jgi:hypothetical protein
MKRNITALLLIAVLLLAAAGCTQAPPAAEAKWTVTIEAGDDTFEFTDLDAADLTPVDVETNRTDRDGNALDQIWTGVALKDVLEAKGVTEFSSALVEAADGYSKEYSAEVINNSETIMAWLLDGEEMDEEAGGPVQMIPKGEANNMFIKNLSKVIIQ